MSPAPLHPLPGPSRLPPDLLGLTPGTLVPDRTGSCARAIDALVRAATAAVAGGLRALLVREPSLPDGAVLELALRLRIVLGGEAGGALPPLESSVAPGWLGIHDRVHLAGAARADGVYLNARSLPVDLARAVAGTEVAIGVSTHDGDDESIWSGADFVLHAPVFSPHSKSPAKAASGSQRGEPLGASGLRAFCERCPLPVFALGGIDADAMRSLSSGGQQRFALIGALWGTDASPLDGVLRSPLADVQAIHGNAGRLAAAAARVQDVR